MKRWKKILLVLLLIVVLSQAPAVYHLYCTFWQSSMIAAAETREERKTKTGFGFDDYAGVIHVHSEIGGHSYGRADDLKSAAALNELAFVVMTEHISGDRDTFGKSIEGLHEGVLFIGGHEVGIREENRFLVVEGFPELTASTGLSLKEFLERVKTPDRLALVTHPERGVQPNNADGIEIFSLHNKANEMNKLAFAADALWSFPSYPELTFARHFTRPDENLKLFDRISSERRFSLFAGNDAHSNVGFQIGGTANDPYFELILDRYQMMFRIVRTHILLEKGTALTKEAVIEAIRSGNCFVGLDVLGNTAGFALEAFAEDSRAFMGEEVTFAKGMRLRSVAPQTARFLVFRNGSKFHESEMTNRIELDLRSPGVYRVEVYRDDLGSPFESVPWIISNPVYVK